MLRAVGMGDDDWEKPQIGIASSWNEITPCNLSLDRLALAAKEGVHDAGGYPLQFGTISVSDGVAMGWTGSYATGNAGDISAAYREATRVRVNFFRALAGVPADSRTETFVSLKAHIDNWRWGNVPFFLRTGKCLAERCSEIVIDFAGQPFSLFPDTYRSAGNRLVIRLQPEESVQLQIMAKEPGSGMKRRPVTLDLDLHAAFTERRAEAYERLLVDVIRGRLTHFMRHDELEAAWAWVEPILHGWAAQGDAPRPYAAGTWGPAASSALMARHDMQWSEEA